MKPYYSDELVTLYCADSRDALPSLSSASVDLVVTSPPYNLGVTTVGGFPTGHYPTDAPFGKRGGMGKWSSAALAEGYEDYDDAMPPAEYEAWQRETLTQLWRVVNDKGAIYYNHKPRVLDGVLVEPRDYVPPELPLRQRVIWARAGGVNFSTVFYVPTYEEILIIAKPDFRLKSKGASGVGDVWTIPQVSNTWHPAPFPLVLAERVIETVRPALVCDPFMGSGTTAKAAKRYGVDWMGCEKSAKYAARAMLEIDATQPRAAAIIVDQEEMFV